MQDHQETTPFTATGNTGTNLRSSNILQSTERQSIVNEIPANSNESNTISIPQNNLPSTSFLSHQLQNESVSTPMMRHPGVERVRQNEQLVAGSSPSLNNQEGDPSAANEDEGTPRRGLEPMNLTFTP